MNQPTTDFSKALQLLVEGHVEFIVIGGIAATLHGSPRATLDLDVVYSRRGENLLRLARALKRFSPYPRGAPPGLPFHWDEVTLRNGLNFTLMTSFGPLDLLGEVVGGRTYEELLPHSAAVDAFGVRFLRVGLEKLIQMKRAAGRPKDFESIAELQALREERRSQPPDRPNG